MSLKDKLWSLVSEYVRRKENGICFTCGRRYWDEGLGENDWKRMDAGHFQHGALDYDLMNIHCQCPKCNRYEGGRLGVYALKLVDIYGREAVDDLIYRSKQAFKPSDEWIYSEIEKFKLLLKEL